MDYQPVKYGYQLRLEKGEEIHRSLRKFIEHTGIKGGCVVGLGAMSSYVLGYYDIHQKEYLRKEYSDDVELVSCVGNIAFKGSEPITHLHALVSNHEMETRGGHLFEGIISATGEFSIIDSDVALARFDKKTGLPLLDLPHKL